MIDAILNSAHKLEGESTDLDPLLELCAGARVVLIGESTHGTHDFYRLRADLSKRLIREHGFTAIAAEADWPDAYRVNRYVRGQGDDDDATMALGDFRRFPHWMWRNADVLDFVGWLRTHNDARTPDLRAGFYGLDLYSLHSSMDAVLGYLDRVDPAAAVRARDRYGCFRHDEPQRYGYRATFGMRPDCEAEVVAELQELQRRAAERVRRDGLVDGDDEFEAIQNARVVADAEQYYRAMFRGRDTSWNLRDTHMADTLDALLAHLGPDSRVIVWAHNSHVGDARATELGKRGGEITIGQLARERHPDEAVLIGMTTYSGTVTAATDWDGPAERKRVKAGMTGSYEELFHKTGLDRFALVLRDLGEAAGGLREERLERAIGVIYRPDTERQSHYFHARLPAQFDAIIHLDTTRALEPLEQVPTVAATADGEAPETYPSGV